MRLLMSLIALTVAAPFAISHMGKELVSSSDPFGERATVVRVVAPSQMPYVPAPQNSDVSLDETQRDAAGFRLSSAR